MVGGNYQVKLIEDGSVDINSICRVNRMPALKVKVPKVILGIKVVPR